MPSIKNEGDSDGDDDMSGAESQHSGSSRLPDRDSSGEDADEPDSDDSSEMDEIECERRRSDCIDNLCELHTSQNFSRSSRKYISYNFYIQQIWKDNFPYYVNSCIANVSIKLMYN